MTKSANSYPSLEGRVKQRRRSTGKAGCHNSPPTELPFRLIFALSCSVFCSDSRDLWEALFGTSDLRRGGGFAARDLAF
jgi:hypothetical protein